MYKLIFSTFIVIFLAELGDKTQLSTMLLASRCKSIWPIFIGSALALTLSSFIGCIAGTAINKYIPASYIQNAAGLSFIILGILMLCGKLS